MFDYSERTLGFLTAYPGHIRRRFAICSLHRLGKCCWHFQFRKVKLCFVVAEYFGYNRSMGNQALNQKSENV